jgi:hypothetical protein
LITRLVSSMLPAPSLHPNFPSSVRLS